jgi:hypothetical protein
MCLNILQLCNGANDCGANDHSDEHLSMCSSFSEFIVSHDDHQKLQLPKYFQECGENEFKCHNGKCINASLACNLNDDCDGDMSDEKGCGK